MEPQRQRILARCILAAFAAACAAWLGHLDYSKKISTNVLDLVPTDERSPELSVVRSLATDLTAKVALFAVRDPVHPDRPPTDAARLLARELAASPLFAEAVVLGEPDAEKNLGKWIFENRYRLLLPKWLGEREREYAATGGAASGYSRWLAQRAASELDAFMSRPEAAALQNLVLSDPLLLVPPLIERVKSLGTPGSKADGNALVWARMRPSPLSEEGQGPVFAAVASATGRMQEKHPGLETRWTGINRFAAANRARIESEIKLLNVCSVAAVLAVSCLLVRRIWKILHLVPVIACSLLGAWACSTLAFSRLHILVFVIGSLLSGVAVDYGFYIYMQPSLRPGERYRDKLKRLLKPLLASCLTTVIGFSLLLLSDLPFIRHVGFFVASGLLCALAAAMLYFAQLRNPFLETRPFDRLRAAGRPWMRIVPRLLAGGAAVIALAGPWRLHWRDDVRELEVHEPELEANDGELRALFGQDSEKQAYLTYGKDIVEARQHLEDFLAFERAHGAADTVSFGLVFPTEADWRALPSRLRRLDRFEDDLGAALDSRGYLPASFAGFFDEWRALRAKPPGGSYAALYAGLHANLSGPLAQMYRAEESPSWFITLADAPVDAPPSESLHTVALDQLRMLNGLFSRYRWSALRLSLIGLGLVIASVFAIYPPRRAVRIALLPAGSCFFVFGAFGLAGQTLNLFHLLGAFLGVCLSHNYAIFSSETAQARAAPPPSVRLSALCAAASFGVLGTSGIPVVHALGMTVALIVLTALAAVELEPLVRGSRRRR